MGGECPNLGDRHYYSGTWTGLLVGDDTGDAAGDEAGEITGDALLLPLVAKACEILIIIGGNVGLKTGNFFTDANDTGISAAAGVNFFTGTEVPVPDDGDAAGEAAVGEGTGEATVGEATGEAAVGEVTGEYPLGFLLGFPFFDFPFFDLPFFDLPFFFDLVSFFPLSVPLNGATVGVSVLRFSTFAVSPATITAPCCNVGSIF